MNDIAWIINNLLFIRVIKKIILYSLYILEIIIGYNFVIINKDKLGSIPHKYYKFLIFFLIDFI
jgi:hypothetical protein